MFLPIASIPQDLPIPQFTIEGLPTGHDAPAIEDREFLEILNVVREGEEVEPILQRTHDTELVNGIATVVPGLRWNAIAAMRSTDFGARLDAILKTGKIPRYTVEKVILRTDENDRQSVLYKLAGFNEPLLAFAFKEPETNRSSMTGVVCLHEGKLTLFPFGGISEIAPREPSGEVLPISISPTPRGILSFLLYASYCHDQSMKHHYAWRYDEPKSSEVWHANERSARVLAGKLPVDKDNFHPICGRFRVRVGDDGLVLDGFGDNRTDGDRAMMNIDEALPHVQRLQSYIAGYTPTRMERITRYLEAMASDFDPLTADFPTSLEKLTDIFLLLQQTKKEHEMAPIHDFWEPAARARENRRFLNKGVLNDQP